MACLPAHSPRTFSSIASVAIAGRNVKTVASLIADSGGRRFFLACTGGATSTVLFALGLLTEGGYITLQLATISAYITGNVVQKYNDKKFSNGDFHEYEERSLRSDRGPPAF